MFHYPEISQNYILTICYGKRLYVYDMHHFFLVLLTRWDLCANLGLWRVVLWFVCSEVFCFFDGGVWIFRCSRFFLVGVRVVTPRDLRLVFWSSTLGLKLKRRPSGLSRLFLHSRGLSKSCIICSFPACTRDPSSTRTSSPFSVMRTTVPLSQFPCLLFQRNCTRSFGYMMEG